MRKVHRSGAVRREVDLVKIQGTVNITEDKETARERMSVSA